MSLDKVEIKVLKIHEDERGYLFEGLRADDKLFGGKFGQTLISHVNKDVTKGLHLHHKQTDYTLCAKGKALYVATDGKGVKQFILDGKNPVLIKVPPGIWHGYKAIDGDALLIHVMDETFDPDDTEAKDPDAFGPIWDVED
jgi:dTDP-4-dehydrorhamnose 3,5-epimerase